MADMPPADVAVDIPLVRMLLSDQFPELSGRPLHSVAGGWDNVMVRLGTDLAVRLPRRAAAVPLAEHEHRWLPGIARRVAVPVPAPVRVGAPTAAFERPWSVVRWIQGVSAAGVAPAERSGLAGDLAVFLTQLHMPAPADAPRNPVRGVPLPDRDEAVLGRIAAGMVPRGRELLALWTELRDTAPWEGPPVWLHGDLHPGNVLIHGRTLSGVIDFGDLTAGDPATDLAVGWLAFDRDGRRDFLRSLPSVYRSDAALLRRARGWALALATAFAAHSDDNPAMAAIGAHAIAEVLGSEHPAGAE